MERFIGIRLRRFWALALAAVLGPITTTARETRAPSQDDPVVLTLFHGDGCPHCDRAEDFLVGLEDRWPDLVVEKFEVWNDATNRAQFREVMAELGSEAGAVPTTIVRGRVWVGFSDPIGVEIESVVASLLSDGEMPTPVDSPVVVEMPFVGDVDVGDRSMVLATLLIGFVDGVNPCSLWVLSVLLALVLHSGSRARVMLVGSVFLIVTSELSSRWSPAVSGCSISRNTSRTAVSR